MNEGRGMRFRRAPSDYPRGLLQVACLALMTQLQQFEAMKRLISSRSSDGYLLPARISTVL